MIPALALSLALVSGSHAGTDPIHALDTLYDPAREARLGQQGVDELFEAGILDPDPDPELIADLEGIVRRLQAASGSSGRSVRVYYSPKDDLNAWALPGGHVVVFQGLLDALTREQVAFVLGHELAHVVLRHTANRERVTQAMSAAEQTLSADVDLGLRMEGRFKWNSGPRPESLSAAAASQKRGPARTDGVDTDADRLGDRFEAEVLGTDPQKADTDGGGVVDGQEVADGTDPLDGSDDRRVDVASAEAWAQAEAALSEMGARLRGAHSQLSEAEADLHGTLYALRAGFPASAATGAMEHIASSEMGIDVAAARLAGTQDVDIRSSHPHPLRRIESIRKWIVDIGHTAQLFEVAGDLCRAGAWAEADEAYRLFLGEFPRSIQGWTNKGLCAMRAITADHGGTLLSPDIPLVTSSGVVLRGSGPPPDQLARATADLTHALELDPYYAPARSGLAILATLDGERFKALVQAERVVEDQPDEPAWQNNLAVVLAAGGDEKGADKVLARLNREAPDYVTGLQNRMRLAEERGKDGLARRIERKLPWSWSGDPVDLDGLGALELGADASDFEARMGPSDGWGWTDDGASVQAWYSEGVTAVFGDDGARYIAVDSDWDGEIEGGLRIGSGRDELVEALGPPSAMSTLSAHEGPIAAVYTFGEGELTVSLDPAWQVVSIELGRW